MINSVINQVEFDIYDNVNIYIDLHVNFNFKNYVTNHLRSDVGDQIESQVRFNHIELELRMFHVKI